MASLNQITDIKNPCLVLNPWVNQLKSESFSTNSIDCSGTIQATNFIGKNTTGSTSMKLQASNDLSGVSFLSNGAGNYEIKSLATNKTLIGMNDTNVSISGTTTNDDALAGYVGEYKQVIFGPSSITATGVYQNLSDLQLTAGDWDVHLSSNWSIDNKTDTLAIGISTDQNASTFSDLVEGSNNCRYTAIGLTSGIVVVPASVSELRLSLTAVTNIQIKVTSNYTGAQPTAYGRISARRVR